MKRFFCFLLSAMLMLSLLGCNSMDPADSHTFYYRQAEFQYGTQSSVIASEERDISGHQGDLYYLITLYLSGPSDEDLLSPFPFSTRLSGVELQEDSLFITLTDNSAPMQESEFSLACVCLSLTCFEFPEIRQVTIQHRDRTVTLTREDILLTDVASQ